MSKKDNDEKMFLADVARHEMIVIRDDGVSRHIRFKRPGTYNMYFDLITWRGYLCYTGDMGTYVFSRLDDMFEFFRTDRNDYNHNKKGLSINPQYWGEKLQAVDKCDGFKEYSEDKFKRVINEIVEDHIAEFIDNDESSALSLRNAVLNEVLNHGETEQDAHDAARDFEHEGFEFGDFWEYDLKDYSHRFVWCCYALAWGIKKYDDHKAAVTA